MVHATGIALFLYTPKHPRKLHVSLILQRGRSEEGHRRRQRAIRSSFVTRVSHADEKAGHAN